MPLPLPAPAVRGGPGFRLLPTPIQSIVYTKSTLYAMKSIPRPRSAGHRAARGGRAAQGGFLSRPAGLLRGRFVLSDKAERAAICILFWNIQSFYYTLYFRSVLLRCESNVPRRAEPSCPGEVPGLFLRKRSIINGQAAFALRACPFALFFRLFSAVRPTQAGTACSGASGSRAIFAQ